MPFPIFIGWLPAIVLGSYALAAIIVALWAWILGAIVAVWLGFLIHDFFFEWLPMRRDWRNYRRGIPPAKERG